MPEHAVETDRRARPENPGALHRPVRRAHHRVMHVVVVGGGIGGLTLGLMLHARGIGCEIFDAAPVMRELGVGINVLPHAVMIDRQEREAIVKGYARLAGFAVDQVQVPDGEQPARRAQRG